MRFCVGDSQHTDMFFLAIFSSWRELSESRDVVSLRVMKTEKIVRVCYFPYVQRNGDNSVVHWDLLERIP